jgi:hypothetical protein
MDSRDEAEKYGACFRSSGTTGFTRSTQGGLTVYANMHRVHGHVQLFPMCYHMRFGELAPAMRGT